MNFIKLLDSFTLDGLNKEEKDIFLSRKEAFSKMGGYIKKRL